MTQEKIVQTAGRTRLGEFAPKFAELNDDVLFGEVWSRTDKLGLRDRSLVTVTSLISQGITDNSLVFHLQSAKKNGITRTEIAEIITHIGFYVFLRHESPLYSVRYTFSGTRHHRHFPAVTAYYSVSAAHSRPLCTQFPPPLQPAAAP